MLEIKVTIEAEGLSQAIGKLADALKGSVILSPGGVEAPLNGVHMAEVNPLQAASATVESVQPVQKNAEAGPQNAVDQKPVNAVTQQQGFMNPPVQNAAPVIDLETISRAGAALIDQGKMNDVLALLKQFGVQAVNLLDPSQYPAFAEGLKALGASI